MKLKDVLNIKNVASFIEGYSKYFYDKTVGLPDHIQEQMLYRLSQCEDDCLVTGKCKHCGCPPEKKVFVKKSCNHGERFPDLMDEEQWKEFKELNNIQ